ncbi:MAG: hypothetical protein RL410_74 [Actinomycetota bacterium]
MPAVTWQYFPKSEACPETLVNVVTVFEDAFHALGSHNHPGQSSNEALGHVRPGLLDLGFDVESGKTAELKIAVPVLYGANGIPVKTFEADAFHREHGIVLEVEAGRAHANNQFLKDIFQACVMQGVLYLAIAVRNDYRGSDDFAKICTFLETLYASNRLNLPLKGILLVGY